MNKTIIAVLACITVVLAGVLVFSLLMQSNQNITPKQTTTTKPTVQTVNTNQVVVPPPSNTNTSVDIINDNVETSVEITK